MSRPIGSLRRWHGVAPLPRRLQTLRCFTGWSRSTTTLWTTSPRECLSSSVSLSLLLCLLCALSVSAGDGLVVADFVPVGVYVPPMRREVCWFQREVTMPQEASGSLTTRQLCRASKLQRAMDMLAWSALQVWQSAAPKAHRIPDHGSRLPISRSRSVLEFGWMRMAAGATSVVASRVCPRHQPLPLRAFARGPRQWSPRLPRSHSAHNAEVQWSGELPATAAVSLAAGPSRSAAELAPYARHQHEAEALETSRRFA